MKKFIIFLFLLFYIITLLNASEQLVVVISDDFNSSTAKLKRFEKQNNHFLQVGKTIKVNLGRNGLGWGIGKYSVSHNSGDPIKYEGDGKAPAGIFNLGSAFGYADKINSKMPYIQASSDLICIDDSKSKYYNKLKRIGVDVEISSFEWMRRDDNLYEIGLNVNHNVDSISKRGSCIFLHVEKGSEQPTSGCTSMKYSDLKELLKWLNPQLDPLLIQIPISYCLSIEENFYGICVE